MESYNGSGFGVHTVEVLIQNEKYKATIIVEVGGNCEGGSILSSVLSTLEEDFEPNMTFADNIKHIELDDQEYVRHYQLFDGEDELLIDGTDIEDSIVGVKIIHWKPQS